MLFRWQEFYSYAQLISPRPVSRVHNSQKTIPAVVCFHTRHVRTICETFPDVLGTSDYEKQQSRVHSCAYTGRHRQQQLHVVWLSSNATETEQVIAVSVDVFSFPERQKQSWIQRCKVYTSRTLHWSWCVLQVVQTVSECTSFGV